MLHFRLLKQDIVYLRPPRRFYAVAARSGPLRILFCGSDDFSITSLKALHREHLQNKSFIQSIDVVCRPGKRVGRGLKNIRQGLLASSLRTFLCNCSDFDQSSHCGCRPKLGFASTRGGHIYWMEGETAVFGVRFLCDEMLKFAPKLPEKIDEHINLIIAVSFGKLVPRRLLEGAKYGGLNLHPSLLPE